MVIDFFLMFAGITSFNGYWGCERCRTSGTPVESKSTAVKAQDLSRKHGSYPHQEPEVDQDNDDDGAAQQENGVVAAGKRPPKKGRGTSVKFPDLNAALRKDRNWHHYRKREREEKKVSIFIIHY